MLSHNNLDTYYLAQIFLYTQVNFNGVKDYNTSFSVSGNFTLQANTVVIEGLVPGTTYKVLIQAVNGATRNNGLGMASDPVTATTDSGK